LNGSISDNDMYGQFTLLSEITSHHITVDALDIRARFRMEGYLGYTVWTLEAGSKIAAFNWDKSDPLS